MGNKKYQHPGVKDFPHFSLKRNDFLNKKLKCFPGPKQRPDAAEGGVVYSSPLDWPKKGAVLRVPRVIWLSAYFPDAYNTPGSYDLQLSGLRLRTAHTGTQTARTIETEQEAANGPCTYAEVIKNGASFTDGFYTYQLSDSYTITSGGTVGDPPLPLCDLYTASHFTTTNVGTPQRSPWYDQHITNPYIAIRANLYNTVFPAVKTAIEKKYPTTYVEIIEWYQLPSVDNDHGGWPNKKYSIGPGIYSPHIGPLMTEPCFGTDFLYLHIGYPVNLSIGDNSPPNFNPDFDLNLDDDPTFTFGITQLTRYKDIMAGYAIKMWGFNPTIGNFPAAESIPHNNIFLPPNIEESVWLPDLVTDAPFTAADAANAAAISGANDHNHLTIAQVNTMIEQFVTKSAVKADYKYMGNSGDTVGSTDLIQIIKDYYKLS